MMRHYNEDIRFHPATVRQLDAHNYSFACDIERREPFEPAQDRGGGSREIESFGGFCRIGDYPQHTGHRGGHPIPRTLPPDNLPCAICRDDESRILQHLVDCVTEGSWVIWRYDNTTPGSLDQLLCARNPRHNDRASACNVFIKL